MFVYCTQRLHLSEAVAYRRIAVARAALRYPVLLAMLQDGRLHLTGMALLAPLLTEGNCESLLARATHRSKREIEEIVVALAPRRDVRPAIRKLRETRGVPSRRESDGSMPVGLAIDKTAATSPGVLTPLELSPGPVELSPGRVAALSVVPPQEVQPRGIEPLSPGRYKVQFTATAELRDKIERLTALMRSEVPSGDLAQILERAVTEKLARLEAKRYGATQAPKQTLPATDTRIAPISRHIPAAVRRAVYERDGDRCRFVDEHGRRCSERSRLEFHHRRPFGMGETTASTTSACCARRTTAAWPRSTTARRQALEPERKKCETADEVPTPMQPREARVRGVTRGRLERWGPSRG
jgi:hypothetical protein